MGCRQLRHTHSTAGRLWFRKPVPSLPSLHSVFVASRLSFLFGRFTVVVCHPVTPFFPFFTSFFSLRLVLFPPTYPHPCSSSYSSNKASFWPKSNIHRWHRSYARWDSWLIFPGLSAVFNNLLRSTHSQWKDRYVWGEYSARGRACGWTETCPPVLEQAVSWTDAVLS